MYETVLHFKIVSLHFLEATNQNLRFKFREFGICRTVVDILQDFGFLQVHRQYLLQVIPCLISS